MVIYKIQRAHSDRTSAARMAHTVAAGSRDRRHKSTTNCFVVLPHILYVFRGSGLKQCALRSWAPEALDVVQLRIAHAHLRVRVPHKITAAALVHLARNLGGDALVRPLRHR